MTIVDKAHYTMLISYEKLYFSMSDKLCIIITVSLAWHGRERVVLLQASASVVTGF